MLHDFPHSELRFECRSASSKSSWWNTEPCHKTYELKKQGGPSVSPYICTMTILQMMQMMLQLTILLKGHFSYTWNVNVSIIGMTTRWSVLSQLQTRFESRLQWKRWGSYCRPWFKGLFSLPKMICMPFLEFLLLFLFGGEKFSVWQHDTRLLLLFIIKCSSQSQG